MRRRKGPSKRRHSTPMTGQRRETGRTEHEFDHWEGFAKGGAGVTPRELWV
jgi:hypothetical protein